MSTGVVVAVVAVVVALAFGGYRALTDGRFRGTRAVRATGPAPEEEQPVAVLDGTRWATELGEKATLLQFSSAFCAPCRATRRTLEEVVRIVPGVAHIEVDAEDNLELVRRLGILRTPTTLVLDAAGREVTRASGAPTKQAVIAGIGAAT